MPTCSGGIPIVSGLATKPIARIEMPASRGTECLAIAVLDG